MREDDKKTLDEILNIIRHELEQLVTQRLDLFRAEFKQYFPGPWPIIEDHIEKAKEQINDETLEYLEGVGLVRRPLRFKRDLLKLEVEKGTLLGFLKRTNTILGSFAKVLPILEPVIEYKENVEASIERADEIRKDADNKWT